MPTKNQPSGKPAIQIDKFREAARELETDDSEAAFDRALRKVATTKKPSSGKDGRSKDDRDE